MANLKAGTLIGGNLIWSAGNLPLRTQGNNIYINDSQIYSEFYKPTPAAIGAVNKAGDTMTGTLITKQIKVTDQYALTTSTGGNTQGVFLGFSGSDRRTIIGGGDAAAGTVIIRPRGIGDANANTIFNNDGTITSGATPTSGAHLTRKDYVDSQVATKVALAGSTMTGKLTLNYTSSVKVPVGTSAQRGSGVTGDFRFNSDEKSYEGFDGTEWQPIGSGRVAYTRHTANFTGVKGKGHLVDTTKAGIVATLPSGMKESDFVVIGDGAGNASKNPFYVAGYNGDRIVVNSDNCMLLFSWVSGKWVITNGIGESGAIDTANYVRKAGDTFTGDMKFNPGTKLRFATTDWANGSELYARPAGDGFGANVYLYAGGNLVLGSGESSRNLESLTNGEHLYLTSDGNVDIITGGNTWADRKVLRVDTAGGVFINNGQTVARCHFGSSNTYVARSGDTLYVAANGAQGRVYIEGKLTPMARVGTSDYEIYHKGNKPTTGEIQAAKSIGEWSTGTASNITTVEFIQMLTDKGAFNDRYWVARGSWSYANNKTITDTGLGNIHLSGCTIEVISASANVYTIRITTPTTSTNGGVTNGEFIYVNNGSTYSPGWRRQYNTQFKPSATDVLTGSTSAADLQITKNKAAVILRGGIADNPENYGRIKFEHNSGDQHVHILHTVHDAHRPPFGLRVQKGEGNASATHKAWLEAEGEIYADGDKRVYHQGWKPTAADVGLGNVPNTVHTTANTANTVAVRDGSADISARLFRSSYADQNTISGAIAYRTNNSSDNYIRYCSDVNVVRNWLNAQGKSDIRSNSMNNVQTTIPATENGDMNSQIAGYYGLYNGNTVKNSPYKGYFYAETKSIYSTGALVQITWPYDGYGGVYHRNYSMNTKSWTPWVEVHSTLNNKGVNIGDIFVCANGWTADPTEFVVMETPTHYYFQGIFRGGTSGHVGNFKRNVRFSYVPYLIPGNYTVYADRLPNGTQLTCTAAANQAWIMMTMLAQKM